MKNKIFIIKARLSHGDKYDYSLINYTNNKTKIKVLCSKHGDKYNYSKVIYNNNKTKVVISCPRHGDFKQAPNNHITNKQGCPICKESKGEIQVRKYLTENNIKFMTQYKFSNCRYKNPLPFDFYLPNYNICIEYNGMQHFKPVKIFGGVKAFKQQKIRDGIKSNYCLVNNIKLINLSDITLINEELNKEFLI